MPDASDPLGGPSKAGLSRRSGKIGALPPQILMVTAIVGLGTLAVLSMTQVKSLKQRMQEREHEIAALHDQNSQLSQQIRQIETEQQQLQNRLGELRNQLAEATGERDRLRTSMDELQAQHDQLEEERAREQAQFQEEIRQLTRARDDLTDRVQNLESQKRTLEDTSAKLRNRLSFLDRDYQQLLALYQQSQVPPPPQQPFEPGARVVWPGSGQNPGVPSSMTTVPSAPPPLSSAASYGGTPAVGGSAAAPGTPPPQLSPSPNRPTSPQRPTIELAPIVVRRTEHDVTRTLRGRVIEVNPFHRFAVIDKGSIDSVHNGMMFEVIRGSETVGHCMAIRVRPQLTACEVISARSKQLPMVGDLAMQTNQ